VAGHRTESERVVAIGTAGRWPWRLAAAKKCVATYLPNCGARKMEGADQWDEAPDVQRGRRARACRGRQCAGTAGGARGADLGSSSNFKSMQRRVRPWKEVMRRLRKGGRVETHGTARWVATRAATAAARRRRLSGTGVGSVMRRATRAAR